MVPSSVVGPVALANLQGRVIVMRAIRVIGRVGVYAHPIVAGPTVGGKEVAQIESASTLVPAGVS